MAIKLTKGTTPVGESYFAHIMKPEEFNGKSTNKFSVMLKLAEKDKKNLLAKIDAEWQNFVESEEGQKHTYKYDYANGIKEYNDDAFFKFKMSHLIQTRKGDTWERHVPIFDSSCKDISNTITGIGNGSKIRVAYELSPYYMNPKNYGVSLRLTGIQVLELVDADSASAESLGFEQTEGYVQEEEDTKIDIPFDTEEEADF